MFIDLKKIQNYLHVTTCMFKIVITSLSLDALLLFCFLLANSGCTADGHH